MDWNPFNYKEVSITVGQYLPTINDSLYEIAGEVSDIREATAKYTVEFGEMIGNGTFYFTRSYRDRPYFHIHTNDGTTGTVELLKLDTYEFNPYIRTVIVFPAKLNVVNAVLLLSADSIISQAAIMWLGLAESTWKTRKNAPCSTFLMRALSWLF